MKAKTRFVLVASAALAAAGLTTALQAQQNAMTFFITSVGSGKGADLGGLAGADQHCQSLAKAAGAGNGRGALISAQPQRAAGKQQMRATVSARVRGRTRKAS